MRKEPTGNTECYWTSTRDSRIPVIQYQRTIRRRVWETSFVPLRVFPIYGVMGKYSSVLSRGLYRGSNGPDPFCYKVMERLNFVEDGPDNTGWSCRGLTGDLSAPTPVV